MTGKQSVRKIPANANGALARAKALTPEARSDAARKAATARWDEERGVLQSQCSGQLTIGNMKFECDVLSDGTRIITQGDFMETMGIYASGAIYKNSVADLPHFLSFKILKPFVDMHFKAPQLITVDYRTKKGQMARGIKAETIPTICEVWMGADEKANLGSRQKQVAQNAKTLMRALAHTGITALVDEATGYQDFRAKDALAKIFTEFLENEQQKWTKTFPLEFYKEIYRLRGWPWKFEPDKRWDMQGPRALAQYTNDLVYDRLLPGLTNELRKKNPVLETGRQSSKHHQWFNPDRGHPRLREHLSGVIAILRLSEDWKSFMRNLDRIYPKHPKPEAESPLIVSQVEKSLDKKK